MKYPYICDITLKRLTMKRLRLGLWACFCLCAATTLMGQNKVKTTAEKVMLFIDGAQVTRTKQVDIPAGNSTLPHILSLPCVRSWTDNTHGIPLLSVPVTRE